MHHILFELFKNSMRAIIESKKSIDLPEIDVLVAQGQRDVTIKISDQVNKVNFISISLHSESAIYSVTTWLDYFFNMWLFITMKNGPIA